MLYVTLQLFFMHLFTLDHPQMEFSYLFMHRFSFVCILCSHIKIQSATGNLQLQFMPSDTQGIRSNLQPFRNSNGRIMIPIFALIFYINKLGKSWFNTTRTCTTAKVLEICPFYENQLLKYCNGYVHVCKNLY